MASLTGAKSASGTLVAATVDTVTLSNPYNVVTVVNESSTGVINFTVDGTTPTSADGFVVGPNSSVSAVLGVRLQGESNQVNGVAAPTITFAADGTPIPSVWITTLSGSKFSRGVDVGNVLTSSAAITNCVVKLISAATPTYSVVGG